MLERTVIGFLGAGSMAEAMLQGLLSTGLVLPEQVWISNRSNAERLQHLQEQWGVHASTDKAKLAAEADLLVLCCKPKDVAALLAEVGPHTRPGQVLLSVAAGISTQTLAESLTPGVHVVRAMPNTSALVLRSATAFCAGAGCSRAAAELCREVLAAVGLVAEVPETLMDAVTGLSGTGPAYVYLLAEAMIGAGEAQGLDGAVARSLVLQTVLGAAHMLAETSEDPAVLRAKVTSPGGTTMAAMQVLAETGFLPNMHHAIARATERSREMGAMWARKATAD